MKNLRLAVLAVFKNESTNLYEWLCHYLDQQVDQIVIVDNGSTDNWRPIVEPLASKGCIHFLSDPRRHSQLKIYRDVLKSGVIKAEWLLVCDMDEFAYAQNGFASLKQYLEKAENKDVSAVMLEVGAFYWTVLAPDIVNPGREEQGSASV